MVTSACTSTARRSGRRTPGTAAPPAGDVGLLTRALAEEAELLAFTTAAASRHPALAALLAPVTRVQREHVAAMQRALQHRSGQRALHPPSVPAGPAVQAQLVTLVRRAERHRLADCLAVESGRLARLLASASASHAVTLDKLRAQR